jgi:ferric-dicitrate binding protein FerR (iron transport regulator)
MGTTKNIKQEDWDVLAKSLFDKPAGESDIQPKAAPFEAADVDDIKRLAKQIDLHFKLNRYNGPKAFSQVKLRVQQLKYRTVSRAILLKSAKIAAILLLAVAIGSAAWFMGQKQLGKVNMAEVIVDDQGLSRIELSDGSIVTLNRDTKINYPDKFGDDIREVSIEGEAFFEVTPDPAKPFIIHAGEATVKVLGTSFSVNAYPENDMVEVIVETGKVQFSKQETSQNTNFNVILDRGERGTYVNASKKLTKCINNDPNFLAWKTRKLIFNGTSLEEVTKQLNKVYRVQVKTDGTNLDTLLLNAHFENEPLDFILEVISATHGLKVEKSTGQFLLKKET